MVWKQVCFAFPLSADLHRFLVGAESCSFGALSFGRRFFGDCFGYARDLGLARTCGMIREVAKVCETRSNKKLLETSASLLVTSALVVVTRSY